MIMDTNLKWNLYHWVQSIYEGIDKVKAWIIMLPLVIPIILIVLGAILLSPIYRVFTILSRIFSVLILGEGRQEQTFDETDADWDVNNFVRYNKSFLGKVYAVLTM